MGGRVVPFTAAEDVITAKNIITKNSRNKTNNPTFITLDENSTVQIYGKTFGAHKYESSMLCYALAMTNKNATVELYEISDNGLSSLPQPSLDVISALGNIVICNTSITLEKKSLRKKKVYVHQYIYNLLSVLGQKRCVLCGCMVQQLIQGAHIWPVANIKKRADLSFDEKFEHATSGNNGLWMCENHHKLFDTNLLKIDEKGSVDIVSSLKKEDLYYVEKRYKE